MKTSIEVTTRAEGNELRQGLADPTVRAFVRVMGTLLQLPSDRSRERVLNYLSDRFAEEANG